MSLSANISSGVPSNVSIGEHKAQPITVSTPAIAANETSAVFIAVFIYV